MNKKIASAELPENDPLFVLRVAVWAGVAHGGTGSYFIVYFADLTAQIIYAWFKRFVHLLVENDPSSFQDREYLAFTVLKGMDTGVYQLVQGIFNNKNQKVYDGRFIQADSVDSSIKQAHGDGKHEVAFWQ